MARCRNPRSACPQQVMLPQTATPAELLILIAGFLLVLSLVLRLAASPRQSSRQA